MIILGIYPCLGLTGFAFVQVEPGAEPVPLAYGAIETKKEIEGVAQSDAARLVVVDKDFRTLLKEHPVDVLAVEIFVPAPTVAHQAPMVLQARGVVLLEAQKRGIPIHEYRPATIKQTVTGRGNARKREVQEAVADLFDLEGVPKPDDAADALAIAYTHYATVAGGLA